MNQHRISLFRRWGSIIRVHSDQPFTARGRLTGLERNKQKRLPGQQTM